MNRKSFREGGWMPYWEKKLLIMKRENFLEIDLDLIKPNVKTDPELDFQKKI